MRTAHAPAARTSRPGGRPLLSFIRTALAYWAPPVLANFLLFGGVLITHYDIPSLKGRQRAIVCAFRETRQEAAYEHEKLIPKSGQRHTLQSAGGVREEKAEIPGWTKYAPQNPNVPAEIVLSLEKTSDQIVFFPRLSGADACVTVEDVKDGEGTTVFELRGAPDVWTPIGAQYRLDVRCLGGPGAAVLKITLRGRWAQLWVRDDNILF